jgi:hypothetical protein
MIDALARRTLALALLGTAITAMWWAGEALPPPDLSLGRLASWWTATGPLAAAAALIRLAAIASGAWLVILTLLDTLALTVDARPMQRMVARMAPVAWRTLVLRPVTVAAMAVPVVISPVAATAPVLAQVIDDVAVHEHAPATLTMVRYSDADTAPTITMRLHRALDEPAPNHTPGPEPSPTSTATHVVAPGENLWSIAAAHLGTQRGQRPTSAEVSSYWQQVIEANRASLPDPSNPDLLYQGIELTMPPVA